MDERWIGSMFKRFEGVLEKRISYYVCEGEGREDVSKEKGICRQGVRGGSREVR